MQGIYTITNLANGKFYVGSTVNAKTRFRTHRRELRLGTHHCEPLQRAWAKYDPSCFRFEVVQEVADRADLCAAENRWLEQHHGQPHCYNVGTRAGAAFLGRTHGENARAKVAEAQKGKQHRLGHTNNPEHRARISAAMKGKKKSPEHAEKIRQLHIGNKYSVGRIVSDETRAKLGRRVAETTTGLEFATIVLAAEHFGIERANIIRTLRNGGLVKRGPHKGMHFRYIEPSAEPC